MNRKSLLHEVLCLVLLLGILLGFLPAGVSHAGAQESPFLSVEDDAAALNPSKAPLPTWERMKA